MVITSLRADTTTRDRIEKYGKMKESMDHLLNRLLDDYDEMKAKLVEVK